MLDDKTVLVTGGTGSFGQAFVGELLAHHGPRKVIVYSRDELKQHEMRGSLPEDSRLRFFIGDVRDRDRLRRAFKDVDVVVHAAALKQVPACEYNPFEAVNTNILGTKNVIDAALDQGVERVLAISTDKAVSPVNLYGATKLCAEKMVVQANAYAHERRPTFSCCRYGNVIGSRGSVIPLFLKQRSTGTLTVTDPRMTRFWLTLENGVRFVLDSLSRMQGGEIFVPKIPSLSVADLAATIAPECEIREMGIRPGEKLHEVLISEDEARTALEFDDHYVVQPSHPYWENEYVGGDPLEEGFSYASDTNSRWLTEIEVLAFARDVEADLGLAPIRNSA